MRVRIRRRVRERFREISKRSADIVGAEFRMTTPFKRGGIGRV